MTEGAVIVVKLAPGRHAVLTERARQCDLALPLVHAALAGRAS